MPATTQNIQIKNESIFVGVVLRPHVPVTDVVVAYNTWVDCTSSWQFGVGSNIDQKDVLPPSEIRSEGLEEKDFEVSELEENIWVPSTGLADVEIHHRFEFDKITKNLFGNSRTKNNSIGAVIGTNLQKPNIMDLSQSQYGPDSYDFTPAQSEPIPHSIGTSEELAETITNAKDGDIIELTATQYSINQPLKINKKLSIQSIDTTKKSTISYTGEAETPTFEMNPKGQLVLKYVRFQGSGENYAFASLQENMPSLYNLKVKHSEISDFDYVLKAYKHSFSEYIKFHTTSIKNCNHGLALSSEEDDR